MGVSNINPFDNWTQLLKTGWAKPHLIMPIILQGNITFCQYFFFIGFIVGKLGPAGRAMIVVPLRAMAFPFSVNKLLTFKVVAIHEAPVFVIVVLQESSFRKSGYLAHYIARDVNKDLRIDSDTFSPYPDGLW